MKERAIWTKFKATTKGTQIWVGVKPADESHRCEGCMFYYTYYDYSCGYGFLRQGCRLGTMKNAMCRAEIRSDKTDIIYRNLGKVIGQ